MATVSNPPVVEPPTVYVVSTAQMYGGSAKRVFASWDKAVEYGNDLQRNMGVRMCKIAIDEVPYDASE
jgi:hypothetical protein